MISRRPPFAIAVVLAALALTACATPASPSSSPKPTSASPTPSATSTPSASPTSAPGALIVSTDGLGPLKLGKPVPSDTGLVSWLPGVCGDGGLWSAGDDAGFGIGTENLTQTGPITAVSVRDPAILTPSGLHVGSTNAEVRAALPKAAYQVADVYGIDDVAWYSVVAGGHRITLSVSTMDGAAVDDGTPVAFIFVMQSTRPDTHYLATDAFIGCA